MRKQKTFNNDNRRSKYIVSKAWKKRERKTRRKMGLFMAPSVLGVSFFYLLPIPIIVMFAFVDNPITCNFVGFDNFKLLWNNMAFKTAAGNTLTFSFLAVPLAVILALLIAILLDQSIPMASSFRSIYLTPMMVPVASVVLVFQVVFDNNGAVNAILTALGRSRIDWLKSDFAPIVVLILFLWKNLGYNMILFLAALGTIPREVIEVALLDTNSRMKLFFKIKLRYLSPTILFVTIMSLINSFKVFREVYLLSGSYPYQSIYTLQHYMNNTFQSLDYQKLSTAAIFMAIVMIIIIAILYFAENRFSRDMEDW